jgi:hypothetical protein
MMNGPDVYAVQTRLLELTYSIGNHDGVYGPTTAGAVRRFQRDNNLEIDGVVGEHTSAKLFAAAANPASAVTPSDIAAKALEKAGQYIGIKEDPPGSNLTQFGKWFGVNGVAWCNIFVSYCFKEGAGYTIVDGFPGGRGVGVFAGKGCSYVPTTEAWLRATGMWIGRSTPIAGDIAIYNWDGGRPDHIGIVVKDLGGGVFEAIEGNTAAGNDSNGGEVMRRRRNMTQVDGFGRIV